MATTTAGNVLAIQGFPEAEWDSRVALLQRYISAGQVIGLVAAGLLARRHPGDGFVFAGVALLVAGALAVASAPGRRAARCATKNRRPGRWWAATPACRGRTIAAIMYPGGSSARTSG